MKDQIKKWGLYLFLLFSILSHWDVFGQPIRIKDIIPIGRLLSRDEVLQIIGRDSCWVCEGYYLCRETKDGELIIAPQDTIPEKVNAHNGDLYCFNADRYNQIFRHKFPQFYRKEFSIQYEKGYSRKWNNSSFIQSDNNRIIFLPDIKKTRPIAALYMLAPVSAQQVQAANDHIENYQLPTFDDYFYDAEPIPVNINQIRGPAHCWEVSGERCDSLDGTLRIVGGFPLGSMRTRRTWVIDSANICIETTVSTRYDNQKFKSQRFFIFRPECVRYYHQGSIIYFDPYMFDRKKEDYFYYRLTPVDMTHCHDAGGAD